MPKSKTAAAAPKRRFVSALYALGVALSLLVAVPALAVEVLKFEAEGFGHGDFARRVVDGSAANGSALRWDGGGIATRRVTLSGPADKIVVRSRNARTSTGSVSITVLVDGAPAGTKRIGARESRYASRTWSVGVAEGTHTIGVRGGGLGGKDRLFADWVRIYGSGGEPTSPPPACEGTEVLPTSNLEAVVDRPNSSWCLRGGVYDEADDQLDIDSPNVTIGNWPGERVELRSQVRADVGGDNLAFRGTDVNGDEGLYFDKSYGQVSWNEMGTRDGTTIYGASTQGFHVYADGVSFENVEIDGSSDEVPQVQTTDPHDPSPGRASGVCVLFAGPEDGATNALVEGSEIHHCGYPPDAPLNGAQGPNPGDHAVYSSVSRGLVVRDDFIHDNGARGVQLRNQTHDATLAGNVIHNNGWGVALDNAVSRSVVRGNVISYNPHASVYTAPNYAGTDNRVVDNCTWQAGGASGLDNIRSTSVEVSGNVTANPRYDPIPKVTDAACLGEYTGTQGR